MSWRQREQQRGCDSLVYGGPAVAFPGLPAMSWQSALDSRHCFVQHPVQLAGRVIGCLLWLLDEFFLLGSLPPVRYR